MFGLARACRVAAASLARGRLSRCALVAPLPCVCLVFSTRARGAHVTTIVTARRSRAGTDTTRDHTAAAAAAAADPPTHRRPLRRPGPPARGIARLHLSELILSQAAMQAAEAAASLVVAAEAGDRAKVERLLAAGAVRTVVVMRMVRMHDDDD